MIIQWCCKGVYPMPDAQVREILTDGAGLVCSLWQASPNPPPLVEALGMLTEDYLDRHVNDYYGPDPADPVRSICDVTPFISLAAGCVERDVQARTNVTHPAHRTALSFATDLGRRPGWVLVCWVPVTVNRAIAVPGVAEEVRDLNRGRWYSDYWAEGEITAKIHVPSTQILAAERWQLDGGRLVCTGLYWNRGFTHPRSVVNEREML